MILPIYAEPNPVLHLATEPIGDITPSLLTLVEDMRETMHNAQGIGLAAPQIGQSISLCVIEIPGDEDEPAVPFLVLVNPRVTWKSKRMVGMDEACLSIPGKEGPVRRPDRVRVKARDLSGNKLEIDADGLLARVLQHEIDHLSGILFTSYVTAGRLKDRPIVDYPRI